MHRLSQPGPLPKNDMTKYVFWVASILSLKVDDRVALLEQNSPSKRVDLLIKLMENSSTTADCVIQ